MPTELQRLIYASRWGAEASDDIDAVVRDIVCVSIDNNRQADLSSLLLVHEGWFVQALEGGRPRIAALMDKLFRDPRHEEIHVLCSGAASGRAFREWSMTAATVGAEAKPFLCELGMLAEFDARRLDGASAFRLLLALAEAERTRARAALGLATAAE